MIRALQALGLAWPRDVSLLAFEHPDWADIVQPALSALIVGYLLAVRDNTDIGPIVLFTLAIGLHIALNAHGLAVKLKSPQGGTVLAAAIAIGTCQ